jgi:tetratricopeptide (TPR) repeat protein
MPALEKIFVILGEQDEGKLDKLSRALSRLFSYVNLTSNLYLVMGSLPENMAQVERIQKDVGEFLRKNLFARLYMHFVHPAPPASMDEIRHSYQYLKRETREFDQEGYMHQEVPRLMLLPVMIPDAEVELASFKDFLDGLRGSFLFPSLCLDQSTSFMAQDEALLGKTEKVYFGHESYREPAQIVSNLCCQDILDDSCTRLEADTVCMTHPCPATLIVSAQDGMVYACMDAFHNKEPLGDIFSGTHVDHMMEHYEGSRGSRSDCLACRGRVAESFAHFPLPAETAHEVGALLYHLGTLHQDAENHVHAVEAFKQSLNLSPAEEAESILFRLGLSYTKTGQYDRAIAAFNSAERAYHDAYYFHFYTGLCHFEMGDYGTAVKKFSDALDLNPEPEDRVRILIYLGTSYNSLGEYEDACSHLEGAKDMAPLVKEVYSSLGFSYFQLKDYDKAIDNLSRAVEIDPLSAIDYASLGANYRDKGDVGQAVAMFKKALTLDPSLTTVRENIARLTEDLSE